jgi:hypothetical protein
MEVSVRPAILCLLLALACVHAPPPPAPVAPDTRPTIRGMPDESVAHLHARIVARSCTGEEQEELVMGAERIMFACVMLAHKPLIECEALACDRLRMTTRQWASR